VAANSVLGTIEGAAFYLFCHDDVELGPDAVQAMVEEAFRSNAGIVGAKLVDWDHPDHLRSVGASVDKFGFAWPIAEINELDQAQHDAVRETFVVSSAAMLVRCDLFADLGGFSTDIDGSGEDLDLCWRARIAGGRTVVMPAAVVRHRADSEVGDPRSSHRLSLRHQARIIAACYSPVHLVRIAPQAIILAILEMLGATVRGHFADARNVASALGWNVIHLPATLRLRGAVKRSRRTADHEIRRLQIKGSVRLTTFVRSRTSGNRNMAATLAAAARNRSGGDGVDPAGGLWSLGVAVGVTIVLLIGSRTLISGGVPAIRDFVPIGSPSQLLREWWSGWRSVGLGHGGGAPTINLVAGLGNLITFGSTGFVRTALILAPLPLGSVAAWRLLRGSASMPARAATLLAYLVNPLPYNAIAEGRWQALVVYAAVPSLLGRIARSGRWAPFDTAVPAPGSVLRQIGGLGLVLFAATTVAPVTALVTIVVAVLVISTLSLLDRDGRPLEALMVVGGGLALSAGLHLPWTVSVLTSSNRWAVLTGSSPSRLAPIGFDRAVFFDTGSHGGYVTVGLLAASAIAVLIASNERFRWAVLSVVLIVVSLGFVVAAGRLAPSIALPPPEVLLSIAAVGAMFGVALVVEAFRSDVVGGSFGWRQLLSVLAVVAVSVSSLPLVVDFLGGRWLAPVSDIDRALAPIRPETAIPNERTLWIGDADALSLRGWEFGEGMKFALTDGVRPTWSSLFPPPIGPAERSLRQVLESASDGGSSRLGAALAPYGIRYVIVEQRLAPLPYGTTVLKIDPLLEEQLDQQFDMARLEVAPGIDAYENLVALPVRSTLSSEDAAALPADGAGDETSTFSPFAASLEVTPWDATGHPPTGFDADIEAGNSLVWLSETDSNWSAAVDGDEIAADEVFGWASRYDAGSAGNATLSYSTPLSQVVLHLLQAAMVGLVFWTRRRPREVSS